LLRHGLLLLLDLRLLLGHLLLLRLELLLGRGYARLNVLRSLKFGAFELDAIGY
jgi:hypothetical protein